ncbi:MAG: PAS domain S-box protein [bacterium]|jgi:PAS domain S-box-containing protein
MSRARESTSLPSLNFRLVLLLLLFLGGLIFILAYLGIQKSRADSLELLRRQGVALIESLALSADNTIKSNSLFDLLTQEKFADLTSFLERRATLNYTSDELADFASEFGVDAIVIYDTAQNLLASGVRGLFVRLDRLNENLLIEIDDLLAEPAERTRFTLIESDLPGEVSMLYLSLTADRSRVIGILSDALFYTSAKKDIGIGYLIQNIAREVGIEYIVFQTADGIVFSSRKIGPLPKIESDSFLVAALSVDTVSSRVYDFNERNVLELVRPFTSIEYQNGLFRIGLSLEKYYDIMKGFDRQMILLSLVIFAAIVLIMLYLAGRQKRFYLDRSLKRMQSLAEKVFESINSGLVVIGKNGQVELANKEFLSIFGLSDSEVTGRNWSEFAYRDIIVIDRLSPAQNSVEYESTLELPSGRKYLLLNLARLLDEKNQEYGVVCLVYDLTRVRELEEASRRKERLTEMGDLAAGVAHEIRNPLNAISIAAQRLLAEFEPKTNSQEFQQFVRQIKSEATRLNEIVTRFLALAKEKSLRHDRINLSRLVEETCHLFRLDMPDKNISFAAGIEPEIYLQAPADRVKQMLINLLRNAAEACEEKGGAVAVNLKKELHEIVLTVRDSGPGIPENLKDKIFTPYFTTRERGTGLGLSIVHQVAEEIGAAIEIVSPTGGGAEFRIKIPMP